MNKNYKKIIIPISLLIISIGFFGHAIKTSALSFIQTPYNDGGAGSPACQVTSATFDAKSIPPALTWGQPITIAGEKGTYNYFLKYYPPSPITINIATQNCVGQKIYVGVYSDFDKGDQPEPEQITKLPNSFVVPSNGQFTISLETGRESCTATIGAGRNSPDSNYNGDCSDYIGAGPNIPVFTKADSGEYTITTGDYYSKYDQADHSKPNPNGKIAYNCAGTFCNSISHLPWNYLSDTSDNPKTGNTTTLETKGGTDTCSGQPGGCYQLYGGLTDIFGALGTKLSVITGSNDLGSFLNALIAIAIGIAGVIAVLRIMYLGVIYMRSDKVTEKLSVRGAIIQTVGGFILLLLVYTILRTINPDLLNLSPQINLQTITDQQKLALDAAGYSTTDQSKAPTKTQADAATKKYASCAAYVTNEYIPARDTALPQATAGMKNLMTAHALMEGFCPPNLNYTSHNPGNIGNTDNGAVVTYPTLADGINAQYKHEAWVATGTSPSYKIGAHIVSPAVTYSGVTYQGIDFIYNGSLDQYLKIYALGARNNTNYLDFIITYFATQAGVTITKDTTIAQIVAMN